MRNLKKVLSLTLAFVMLLGMMVVGAAAATDDLVDFDTVAEDNQEAVTVMNAVNVFVGNDKGEFNPDGKLTRAAAAKIVLSMVQGPTTVDALLKNTTSTLFDDMSAANVSWAAGIVDVCANLNIIKGVGERKFNPNGEVTGIQFAAMVARAADPEGDYSNPDTWETNVRLFAAKNGLDKNTTITDWKAPMTRAQACQMSFNGILYSPSGNSQVYVVTKDGEEVYRGTNETLAMAAQIGNAGSKMTMETVAADDSLAKTVFKLEDSTKSDGFGRTVKTWEVDGEEVYASSESNDAPVKVYTAAATTVEKDLEKYNYTADLKAFVNGVQGNDAAASAANIQALTGNGKTVEVYADSSKKVTKVIVIVPTVATVSADPVTRTNNDTEQVRVPGAVGTWTATSKVSGWEDLVKGDVVLVLKDKDGNITIEKAESITGTVEGYSNTKGVQIDGEYYTVSNVTGVASDLLSNNWNAETDKFKTEWTFYLDASGAVVKYVKAGDDASATASNYAVVREVAWFPGSGFTPNGYMQAKILKTDGTLETVNVTSVDGIVPIYAEAKASDLKKTDETDAVKTNPTSLSAAVSATMGGSGAHEAIGAHKAGDKEYLILGPATDNADATSKYFGVGSTGSLTDSTAKFITLDQFYAYTVDSDGNYALTNLGTSTDAEKLNGDYAQAQPNKAITKGAPKFDTINLGNANTVFLFDNGKDKAPDIYTGIANVPSTTELEAKSGNTMVLAASGMAKFVFVTGATVQNASADVVYIADTGYTANANGLVYNAFINGEPDTITVASAQTSLAGLYLVKNVDAKGVSTLWNGTADNTAISMKAGIVANSGNVITVKDTQNVSYLWDDETVVYVIEGTGDKATCTQMTGADVEADGNDKIHVIADPANTSRAATIYLVKVDAPKPTVTLAKGSGITATLPAAGPAADTKVNLTLSASNNTFKVTVAAIADVAANYTVACTQSKDGATAAAYTQDTDITATAGTYVITITVTDKFDTSKVETYTYTFVVAAAAAE